MRILTNTLSLTAQHNMAKSKGSLSQSIERLSSGLRINGAKDDAAGLAIANRMTSKLRGNEQAGRNVKDAISLVQTAESGLNEINENLQRMRELVVQSRNGTNTQVDQNSINKEIDMLMEEINRISESTYHNGISVLGQTTTLDIQIGDGSDNNLKVDLKFVGQHQLGLSPAPVPPMSAALQEITIAPGEVGDDLAGTYEVQFGGIILDGSMLSPQEAAAYYGVSVDDITIHQLDAQTNSLSINVGDKLSFVLSKEEAVRKWKDPVTNVVSYYINNNSNRKARIEDPENGISTIVEFDENRRWGLTPAGSTVQYFEHQGKFFKYSSDGNNDGIMDTPFYLSGPNANYLEVDTLDMLPQLDEAIKRIDEHRSYLGATQNRLESIYPPVSD